jgi:hypothetical protein
VQCDQFGVDPRLGTPLEVGLEHDLDLLGGQGRDQADHADIGVAAAGRDAPQAQPAGVVVDAGLLSEFAPRILQQSGHVQVRPCQRGFHAAAG